MKKVIKPIMYLSILIGSLHNYFAQEKHTSFKPGEIWKDTDGVHINAHGAGILTEQETYYLFGEHKVKGSRGNQSWVGVRVYSSKDLYNWKNEGVALKVTKDPSSKLVEGSVIERPKVIYNDKTKKYVMWFHHELKGQGYHAALFGVAVSDNVTGPYNYIDSYRMHANVWPKNFTEEQKEVAKKMSKEKLKWGEGSGYGVHFLRDFEIGQMSRDMTLFKDDDGSAYHITASEENGTLIVSKLSSDYLSLSDEYIRVFPGGNNEAPAIFKKNGKYFMITSGLTGWAPNPARSAMADNMLGNWTSLGNPAIGNEKERKTTFHSQSTHVLPVLGKKDAYIFMADRWMPQNAIDGRYVWLPIEFEDEKPIIKWFSEWRLDFFDK
tara:strand:- start:81 stop:1220 length:1140 start_codon:yes stop_codon:yes gene_type:complete